MGKSPSERAALSKPCRNVRPALKVVGLSPLYGFFKGIPILFGGLFVEAVGIPILF